MLLERLLSEFGIGIKEAFDIGSAQVIGFLSLRQHPVQSLKYEKRSTESGYSDRLHSEIIFCNKSLAVSLKHNVKLIL